MSIPQFLGVATALILIYYLLGLIVSFFTGRINEIAETRGTVLQDYVKNIVGEGKVGDFYQLPQLDSLKPVRYSGLLGAVTGKTEIKNKIESIPVANLVDAFFDFCKISKTKTDYTVPELTQLINNLPNSQGKTRLLALVNQQVTDVNQLRNKVSMWFSGLMDQAAMQYKARARKWVIFLSVIVTLAFAADTIDLANQFLNNSVLLTAANAKATEIVQNQPDANLNSIVAQLGDLNIKYGWKQLIVEFQAQDPAHIPSWLFWKIVGLILTAVAVSQGSSFWYDILRRLKGENATPPKDTNQPDNAVG